MLLRSYTGKHRKVSTVSLSFDRDMPIKFLPIKWEKLLRKIEAAEKVGIEKAITFEFSHFMSPNSSYPQAHGLYKQYLEWLSHPRDAGGD